MRRRAGRHHASMPDGALTSPTFIRSVTRVHGRAPCPGGAGRQPRPSSGGDERLGRTSSPTGAARDVTRVTSRHIRAEVGRMPVLGPRPSASQQWSQQVSGLDEQDSGACRRLALGA